MAIEFDGILLDAEDDFSAPEPESFSSPEMSADPIEYDGIPLEAPEVDTPFITENVKDIPTVQSLGELPADLMNRTLTHAKGGVESFVGGIESLAPGSENTIWRRRQQNEGAVPYLLSKLAPLGILGGPVETVASPLTAMFSEGARLGGEVERKVRGLRPEDTPFLHKAEPFAPMAGSLALAPFVPTWLGGMKRAAEASSAGATGRAASRAAEGFQSTEGALKGMAARGSEAAGDLGSMLRTTAAEGDRLSALAGGEARFRAGTVARSTDELMPTAELGAENTSRLEQLRAKFPERATTAIPDRPEPGDLTDPGLLSRLQKLKKEDPESYGQVLLAANPQSQVERLPGYEIFSRAKTSENWKRGLSRTASEYIHVPEELADEVEKISRVGRKGKLNVSETNLMAAFNKRFGSDETGVGDAILEKLARTTIQLREGAMTVPWVQPLKSTGLAEVQPSLRSLLHSSRGVGVRAQRQLDARARSAAGKDVQFNRAPAGTYWPHAYEPEVSAAIRAEKEAERMKAGLPVTTQHDIISGEDFTNMTRGARARRGAEETNALVRDYIKDPIAMLNTNSQNWGRMLGRTSALGPKGEKWTAKIKQLVDEVGPEIAKNIDHAARRDFNFIPPRNRVADVLTTFEAMTKMSLSFVSNASQPALNIVVNGAKDTVKGIWDTIHQAVSNKSMNAITKELGIVRRAAEDALRHEMGGTIVATKLGKVADKVLAPFMKIEGPWNRNLSAATGMNTMKRLSKKLESLTFDEADTAAMRLSKVQTALRPSEWRNLKKSDLPIKDIQSRIASSGGGLNWNEIRRGSWSLVDRTQFLQRPTAVPYLTRNSSMARVLTQMKTFSMRASGMIMEEVVKEATAGNYAPLARMAYTFPIVGEASRQVNTVLRHPITGKEEFPTDAQGIIKRALEDSIYVGGLGIFSDAVSAAVRGKESWTGLFAGPGITDIGTELKSIYDMGQHRFGGLAERQKYNESQRKWLMGWAKRVPFAGSALAETMKTPQEIAKTIKSR